MTAQTRIDQKRGCGWRKPGGLYLVGPETGQSCGLLPIPLDRCPCCDQGIKPTRGWTWVDVEKLISGRDCAAGDRLACRTCPARRITGKHGLLWIGEQFYATPHEFMQEVSRQGISRRITAVPKGFTVGETWVLLAHRKAIIKDHPDRPGLEAVYTPGVFQMFRPSAVEYVTKGSETEEELEALTKRGIIPVTVVRDDGTLFGATGGVPQ